MSEENQIGPRENNADCTTDVFLLTAPPRHDRAVLCKKLITQSENAVLCLAGDGVYNLLDPAIKGIEKEKILVCREDMEARGLHEEGRDVVPEDFYEHIVKLMMNEGNRSFTF